MTISNYFKNELEIRFLNTRETSVEQYQKILNETFNNIVIVEKNNENNIILTFNFDDEKLIYEFIFVNDTPFNRVDKIIKRE
jgi:long-subunit acyl-CoA synthetase (AMP-forming)